METIGRLHGAEFEELTFRIESCKGLGWSDCHGLAEQELPWCGIVEFGCFTSIRHGASNTHCLAMYLKPDSAAHPCQKHFCSHGARGVHCR